MLVVVVEAIVKLESAVDFMAASQENAKASLTEPGIARFDVLRDASTPERFILIEVYRNASAAADHKATPIREVARHCRADDAKASLQHSIRKRVPGRRGVERRQVIRSGFQNR